MIDRHACTGRGRTRARAVFTCRYGNRDGGLPDCRPAAPLGLRPRPGRGGRGWHCIAGITEGVT